MMNTLVITRQMTGGEGTFGRMEAEALLMQSGELPWHNNARNISCIPVGTYLCKPHISPTHGKCFWVQDVPGRSEILIHAASWMGDKALGWKSSLAGCIAIGMRFIKDADEHDQDMIKDSQIAIRKLIEYTEFKPFMLEIRNETNTPMDVSG